MKNVRLIARLDIKGPALIKGVHLEGLRVIGDPQDYARRYYEQGADELIYIDVVASLYGRNKLTDIVSRAACDLFVPMTVGGGIRNVEDVTDLLRSGADKIAINTGAVQRPELISDVARRFGSQCMVLSIEAKQTGPGRWEVYTDGGREKSRLDAVEWAKRAAGLGVGEMLITSIDREGTRKGFDVALTAAISQSVDVPVIASGGYGEIQHLVDVVNEGGADAVAIADAVHYNRTTLGDIRTAARAAGISLRQL
jgi:cyclase